MKNNYSHHSNFRFTPYTETNSQYNEMIFTSVAFCPCACSKHILIEIYILLCAIQVITFFPHKRGFFPVSYYLPLHSRQGNTLNKLPLSKEKNQN